MAHKKQGGSTALGRDSISKRLGVKRFAGQQVRAGEVLIRQRGSRYRAGEGVKMGADDTLYAAHAGVVSFLDKKIKRFTGALKKTKFISVK